MRLRLRLQAMFWPILWLVGFRIRWVDGIGEFKIPRWIPERQRRKIAAGFNEAVKWQKFDTRIR